MLDNFLSWLDNPGRAVGIDPDKIDPRDRGAYRGAVLSAAFDSLRSDGPSFGASLSGMGRAMKERQEADEAARLQEDMKKQLAQVGQAGGDNAEIYMRYAQMFAAQGKPDMAKKYFDMAQALKPTAEEYGQPVSVTGPDGKPMLVQFSKTGARRAVNEFTPEVKTEATPASIREYNFAVGQGYKGTFAQFQLEQKRAGASNVNVNNSTNIDPSKKLGDTLGVGVGDVINNTFAGARAAQGTLGNVTQMRQALGNAITGPFADQRAFLARLQSGLGVAPGDTPDRLADTRRVIQGLARSELAAAEQMRGQGAITESERAILRRAESGEINLSPAEIRVVMDALEGTARRRIQAHQNNLQRLRKVPGAEGIIPFYELDDGPGSSPEAQGVPGGIQDAARRELERRQRGGR